MQREIKYHGKRVDNSEWVFGYFVKAWDNSYYIITEFGSDVTCCSDCGANVITTYEVTPETVGQYTGLKDKNGKEIYEDDIIEYCGSQLLESYKALIKYKDDRFVAVWIDDSKLFRKDIFFWATERKIQIIGNIHENPELLQEVSE